MKLSTDSLDWALQHALTEGDTDIFPNAFEYEAIAHTWPTIRDHLASQDVTAWQTRPLRRCLSPNGRYGFRIATQLDPLDFLLFSALVYEIGGDLEAHRVADTIASSYRFAPSDSGALYNPVYRYSNFQSSTHDISHEFPYVVVTDIADFFPRLYFHRLENALDATTTKSQHASAIKSLIKQWNQNLSYGIPIGPAPSRLLAEITISDVDKLLMSEKVHFVRYVDDYRIFANSPLHAYKQLVLLANALFKLHGLTLQKQKTHVVSNEKFRAQFCRISEAEELSNLTDRFRHFLNLAGIDSPYEDIDYDDLEPEHQSLIDSFNLEDLLEEEIGNSFPDYQMIKFLLRRLGQLNNQRCLRIIVSNFEELFTVFPDIIRYLGRLKSLGKKVRHEIGESILSLFNRSDLAELEFHRSWIFHLFSDGRDWGVSGELPSLYTRYPDSFSRGNLILALGRGHHDYWFRTYKDTIFQLDPWVRRAFLAGASCLPPDERRHWYRSIEEKLDPLEEAVVAWARARPF